MGDRLSPDNRGGEAFDLKGAAAVLLAAFALRAVFLWAWGGLPYAGAFSADAWVHDKWALEILEKGPLRHTAFYQSSFYPYFLALFYKVLGHKPHLVYWTQALADSAGCVILMRAAALCFGRGAGRAAGLLAATYRPFIFSTGLLTKETFLVFSQGLTLLLLLRAGRTGRPRDNLLWGLVLGWGTISRPNALLLLPCALLWLRLKEGGGAGPGPFLRRAVLPALAGALLAVAPVTLHNWLAARDFVPLSYMSGFVLYLGNNPEATGILNYPEGISSDPVFEETETTAIAERAAGRELKPSEVSAWWAGRALDFIRHEPLAALKLAAKKAFLFWNRYEVPDNYDLDFISSSFSTALSWPLVSFALAGTLGAFGLFLCRFRENSGALALLFWPHFLSVLPFVMTDRYRLPAAALLLAASGGALARLAEAWRGKTAKGLLAPALFSLPFAAACLLPPPFDLAHNRAAGWGQLVTLYSERGEHHMALDAFERASAVKASGVSDSAAAAAASSLIELGRDEEALEIYDRWSAVYPSSGMLLNNKGALLYRLGRYRESAAALEASIGADHVPGIQYRGLFYAYSKLKDRERACRYGVKAAALAPDDSGLRAALASPALRCSLFDFTHNLQKVK